MTWVAPDGLRGAIAGLVKTRAATGKSEGAAATGVLGAGTAQAAPFAAPAFHLTADSSGAPPVQGLPSVRTRAPR